MTIQGLYHLITTSHGDKNVIGKYVNRHNLNSFLHINFNIVLGNFVKKFITHALICLII